MNKRVLFFMTSLQSGGGERVTVDIMNHLAENGYDITLAVMNKRGFYLTQISPAIKIYDLKTARFIHSIFSLRTIIRNIKPSAIFSSSIHTNIAMLAAVIFSGVRTRTVIRVGVPLSVVFGRFSSFKDGVLVPMLTKFLYKKADIVLAVSKGIADDIASFTGLRRESITVIYNPKNIPEVQKKADEHIPEVFKSQTGPFIVFIGRLVKEKNIPLLIEAFSLLRKKINAHLILIGDGGEKEMIQKLSKQLNMAEHVSFEGMQDNPYVYMKNADVLALSSLSEGLSNVLIEALICKTPIVATDCPAGGSREILAPETDYRLRLLDKIEKTKTGYLVPTTNPELMARAIFETLSMTGLGFNYDRFSKEHIMVQYGLIFASRDLPDEN